MSNINLPPSAISYNLSKIAEIEKRITRLEVLLSTFIQYSIAQDALRGELGPFIELTSEQSAETVKERTRHLQQITEIIGEIASER